MTKETEKQIMLDVLITINNTFEHDYDENGKNDQEIDKFMQEYFIPPIITDLSKSRSNKGIQFPLIKSTFSYFFTKTIDSVLIKHKEKVLWFGKNVLYDFEDIKDRTCGISEYFYEFADPNAEYYNAEEYFYSFQNVCEKYKHEVEHSLPLALQMIGGGLIAIIPMAIQKGYSFIYK